MVNLDSKIIGTASDAQRVEASGSPLRCRTTMPGGKSRSGDLPQASASRVCGSGLLTAMEFLIRRSLPQRAHTRRCGPGNRSQALRSPAQHFRLRNFRPIKVKVSRTCSLNPAFDRPPFACHPRAAAPNPETGTSPGQSSLQQDPPRKTCWQHLPSPVHRHS